MNFIKHLIEIIFYLIIISLVLYLWNTTLGKIIFSHPDPFTEKFALISSSFFIGLFTLLIIVKLTHKKRLIEHPTHYEIQETGKGIFKKIFPKRINLYYETARCRLGGETIWENEFGNDYFSAGWLNTKLREKRTKYRRVNLGRMNS